MTRRTQELHDEADEDEYEKRIQPPIELNEKQPEEKQEMKPTQEIPSSLPDLYADLPV